MIKISLPCINISESISIGSMKLTNKERVTHLAKHTNPLKVSLMIEF